MKEERGYATVWGVMVTALLILVVGAIYDVYSAFHYRTWAYEVASEAARYAVIEGQAWPAPVAFYMTGEPQIVPGKAVAKAREFVDDAMTARGISDYEVQVRVIVSEGGGSIPNFPPVRWAALDGRDMHLSAPGVGVYLEFPVPTVWLGLIAQDKFTVHVFAAAQIDQMR